MKRFITILILVLTAGFAFSQTAEKVVDNFIDYFSKNNIFEISFDCKVINVDAEINDDLKGKLFMDTTNFRLEIEELLIIDNGTETINYNSDINEVTIFTNDEEDEEVVNPFSLIFNYKKHFILNPVSNFQSMSTIDFLPIEQDFLLKLQLSIDTKTNKVSSLTIIDSNNTEYFYTITKFIPNSKQNKSIFKFDENDFPDAEIIDLRD